MSSGSLDPSMNLIFQGRFKLNCGDLHCARGSVDHLNSFFYYGTSLAVPDIIGRNEASLQAYVKLRSPSQPHRFEGSRISSLWRSLAPGRRRRSMICCASTSFPNDRSQSQPLETLTLRCRLISGKPTFFWQGIDLSMSQAYHAVGLLLNKKSPAMTQERGIV